MYDDSLLQNQEYLQNSSLGAAIDSEQNYAESQDNLARYVFRILYHYEHLDEAVNLVLEIVGKQFDVSRYTVKLLINQLILDTVYWRTAYNNRANFFIF